MLGLPEVAKSSHARTLIVRRSIELDLRQSTFSLLLYLGHYAHQSRENTHFESRLRPARLAFAGLSAKVCSSALDSPAVRPRRPFSLWAIVVTEAICGGDEFSGFL
jgi:hypothetical protein